MLVLIHKIELFLRSLFHFPLWSHINLYSVLIRRRCLIDFGRLLLLKPNLVYLILHSEYLLASRSGAGASIRRGYHGYVDYQRLFSLRYGLAVLTDAALYPHHTVASLAHDQRLRVRRLRSFRYVFRCSIKKEQ